MPTPRVTQHGHQVRRGAVPGPVHQAPQQLQLRLPVDHRHALVRIDSGRTPSTCHSRAVPHLVAQHRELRLQPRALRDPRFAGWARPPAPPRTPRPACRSRSAARPARSPGTAPAPAAVVTAARTPTCAPATVSSSAPRQSRIAIAARTARSALLSSCLGTSNNAIVTDPMVATTTPPKYSTPSRMVSAMPSSTAKRFLSSARSTSVCTISTLTCLRCAGTTVEVNGCNGAGLLHGLLTRLLRLVALVRLGRRVRRLERPRLRQRRQVQHHRPRRAG